jgi:uncharacterized membrane protein
LSAIRLCDGTKIFGHAKRYANGWELEDVYSPDWKSRHLVDGIKIHDDAIQTVLHLLRGGKQKDEPENGKRTQDRNGPPASA